MKARYVAAVAAALWGSSALAATVTCPDPTQPGFNYMTLDTSLSASCWDYGTSTDHTGNPTVTTAAAVILNDKIVQLPLGTSTADTFSTFFGNDEITNAGTSGSFDVAVGSTTPVYLLFKVGSGGPGDYWWYVFKLDTLVADAVINWSITNTNQGNQALSHVELFGGTASTSTSSTGGSGDVPEPGALTLLGLGLLGLGFARRFKKAA